MVDNWKKKLEADDDDMINMKKQYSDICAQRKLLKLQKKAWGHYLEFPDYLFDLIANSTVFLYPDLLPMSPYPPNEMIVHKLYRKPWLSNYFVLGLDQFTQYLVSEKQAEKNIPKKNKRKSEKGRKNKNELEEKSNRIEISKSSLVHYIQKYMFPMLSKEDINNFFSLRNRDYDNPVKRYFEKKELPATNHYVYPLNDFGIIPPIARLPRQLPLTWRQKLHPHYVTKVRNHFNKCFFNCIHI